jgi:DNA-binding NtrC family response regulator
VARLVLFPDQGLDLPGAAEGTGQGAEPAAESAPPAPLLSMPLPAAREMVMERFERSYVAAKLAQHGGNISRAADAMGVSRQLVHRLLERYGMKAK